MVTKQLTISVVLLIGIFTIPYFIKDTKSAPINITSSSWVEIAGDGLIAPACGSSSAGATCVGATPAVTFNWAVESGFPCSSVFIQVDEPGIASGKTKIQDNLPCSGSWTWTTGEPGKAYGYGIFANP